MTTATTDLERAFPNIAASDPQALAAMLAEEERQHHTLELIASENHVSRAVREAVGSVFTNKYAEGYPGRRYYGGCQNMDAIEDLARQRAKKLFGADHVNVQPHSGAQANAAVYLAVLQPGDTLLSLSLAHGGHLSHGLKVNMTGLLFNVVQYEVNPKTEQVDYDVIRRMAAEHKPKLIISGASAYPRTLDFDKFSEIAHEIGAVHMADIAHIAGMVAVGLHPSPVPTADFVTTTTHKTLRGPRGGMILCKEDWAKKCDSRVFPGTQGGPLMHCIAGKAVAFGEALKPEFKQYQQQILDNAQALADALVARGNRLVSGGTDTHLMLLDLRPAYPDVTGKLAEEWLEQAAIVVNKNMIPFDERKPTQTSGLRLGTPALTTRGLREGDMKTIAGWIDRVLRSEGDPKVIEQVRGDVLAMCDQFPLP
ncbi:MAG TPA: serine hydroxymethyltransferase [Phycisphaerae bacterium]|nr:serine hydroxymethyltransferase [Phycisphaerae bacterium]